MIGRDALTTFAATGMHKSATTLTDILYGIGGNTASNLVIPGSGVLAGWGGAIHGLLSDAASPEEVRAFNKDPLKSFVPGVGTSRAMRRWKAQTKDRNGGYGKAWAQALGPLTSMLGVSILGAALGGGIGSLYGRDAAGIGTLVGLGIGGVSSELATLGGAIAAGVKPRRTAAEHDKYINETSAAGDWLIPGVAIYNNFKTLGRAMAEDEKQGGNKKPAKAKKEASLQQRIASIYA